MELKGIKGGMEKQWGQIREGKTGAQIPFSQKQLISWATQGLFRSWQTLREEDTEGCFRKHLNFVTHDVCTNLDGIK